MYGVSQISQATILLKKRNEKENVRSEKVILLHHIINIVQSLINNKNKPVFPT